MQNVNLNFPEIFRKIMKEVNKSNGYTEELANRLATLIHSGGWLYGVLYFSTPLKQPLTGIIDLSVLPGDYTTLLEENGSKRFLALYTSLDYVNNLANIVKVPQYPIPYVCKITVRSMLQKVQETGVDGIILNPHIERLIIANDVNRSV